MHRANPGIMLSIFVIAVIYLSKFVLFVFPAAKLYLVPELIRNNCYIGFILWIAALMTYLFSGEVTQM